MGTVGPGTSTARRRRVPRLPRGVLALVALLVLTAVAGGLWWWQQVDFGARTEPVPGVANVRLRVQDGVPARDVAFVRDGVVAAQRWLDRVLGGGVRGSVEARVARDDPCAPFGAVGRGATGQAQDGRLCVDTRTPSWRRIARDDPVLARGVSAHEHVHVLQAELGCLPPPDEHELLWLFEGTAVHGAWEARVHAGVASPARATRAIRAGGAFEPQVGPLRLYERRGGGDPEYALWHLAVRDLLRRTGRGPLALRRVCAEVGRGRSWSQAFTAVFGLDVGSFYGAFEAARPAYAAGRRAP